MFPRHNQINAVWIHNIAVLMLSLKSYYTPFQHRCQRMIIAGHGLSIHVPTREVMRSCTRWTWVIAELTHHWWLYISQHQPLWIWLNPYCNTEDIISHLMQVRKATHARLQIRTQSTCIQCNCTCVHSSSASFQLYTKHTHCNHKCDYYNCYTVLEWWVLRWYNVSEIISESTAPIL